MSNAATAKTTLVDFAPGDPCGPIAHALAIGDMWTPEQWNAAVDLVNELRLQGLLAPLPAQAAAPTADEDAASRMHG